MTDTTENSPEQLEAALAVLLRNNRWLESQLAHERKAASEAEQRATERAIAALTGILRRCNSYVVHLGDPDCYQADMERIKEMMAGQEGFIRLSDGVWRLEDARLAAAGRSGVPLTALTFGLQTSSACDLRRALFEYAVAFAGVPHWGLLRSLSYSVACALGSSTARRAEAAKKDAEETLRRAETTLCQAAEISFYEREIHHDSEFEEGLRVLLLPALERMQEVFTKLSSRRIFGAGGYKIDQHASRGGKEI